MPVKFFCEIAHVFPCSSLANCQTFAFMERVIVEPRRINSL